MLETQLDLAWWTVLPFVALLLCIAILPLVPATEHWWEKNSSKLIVALALGLPVAVYMTVLAGSSPVVHAMVEYAQFIILLLALFTISGGIHLSGDIEAKPRTNVTFIAIGAVVASFIGTTGAAMLLIRPLLKTNAERKLKTHTVIFFIFSVANAGGLLTPLGDPPLFLGLLRGVPFEWTFTLFPQWLFVNALLLISYYALDKVMYAREDPSDIAFDHENVQSLLLLGRRHFIFITMVVIGVAVVPSVDLHTIEEGTAAWFQYVPWREALMLTAAGMSLAFGDRRTRYQDNQFSWTPIVEVAALFVGIFLTMIPALRVLGQLAPSLPLTDITFYLFTGGLSAFLDNAPTYATFFEMAQTLGEVTPGAVMVAGVQSSFLTAISLGAVFFGAMTYIGNGPNFMVKAVAEGAGVKMPSFGGYIGWSCRYLLPILLAMMCLFIAGQWWAKGIGVLLTAGILVLAYRNSRNAVVREPITV
nr:sodium:proton antiporter [Tessaracoccus sp. OS52]